MRLIIAIALLTLPLQTAIAADVPGKSKSPAEKEAASVQTVPKYIQGEVLKIEGDQWIVRDDTRQEVTLHTTPASSVDPNVAVGDRITVQITANSEITSIKKRK